jgi:hypothetical protein
MVRRSFVALAAGLAALGSAAISWAGLGTPTLFADPAGDVTGAPDITDVGVMHTVAGRLIFTVHVPNEPTLVTGHIVELRFDIDTNPSTGSGGSERLVHRLWTGSTRLCTWTGASFSCLSSPSTTSTYVNGLLTVTTTYADLGIGQAFDFSLAGYMPPNFDFAPNSGTWHYFFGRAARWPLS